MIRLSKYLLYSFPLIALLCAPGYSQTLVPGGIVRLDSSIDHILAADAKLELLQGEGIFEGGEGPLWVQRGKTGFLLFSDVSGNQIFEWAPSCSKFPCPPEGKLFVLTAHSGYADKSHVGSVDASGTHLYGSNGLTLDRSGRIVVDANGDRAVERLEKDGTRTVLADRYQGKRLTCPNDIVVKSDGAVYFTDGMAGCLPKREEDPARELPFHGVYSIRNGSLQLLDQVISMGGRNTRTKSQVQEFQWLRIVRQCKCKPIAPCLGKGELQSQGIDPLKPIARSTDERGVASTS